MKTLERIRYNTMNSWNNSTAPAYNLKIYKVIPRELQNKVYELLETDEFYDGINELINDFDRENNYIWQAGFNGRSGGYLVLYRAGIENGRVFTKPGLGISDEELPKEIDKKFHKLASDIINYTINLAKNFNVQEETYTVEKKRKVLVEK